MAILGFILLLLGIAAAAFGVWVATSANAALTSVAAFGNTLNLSPMTILLLGAASVLLVLLGIWLMTAAGRRKVRAGKERRDLEKRQKEQEKELAETRKRLAREDTSRTSTGSPRVESDARTDRGRDTAPPVEPDARADRGRDTAPPAAGNARTDGATRADAATRADGAARTDGDPLR